MEVFLTKTIIPKLAYCLQTMEINPGRQNMREFSGCIVYIYGCTSLGSIHDMVQTSNFSQYILEFNSPSFVISSRARDKVCLSHNLPSLVAIVIHIPFYNRYDKDT